MDQRFPPDLQSYVDQMIASGVFTDVHDLILDAVYRQRDLEMNRRRKHEDLKEAIQLGIDDLDNGRVVDGQEVLERLRKKIETEVVAEI